MLCKTISMLKEGMEIGVIEADVDSDVDAKSVNAAGAKAIQLHTQGMCHVDASMTKQGLDSMGCDELDIVFLENVGNLICTAQFDTGALKSAMLLSVPEGDDKPLKYPIMFSQVDVLLISKIDAIGFFDFDIEAVKKKVYELNPNIKIFPISAKTGEGMDEWTNWIREEVNNYAK